MTQQSALVKEGCGQVTDVICSSVRAYRKEVCCLHIIAMDDQPDCLLALRRAIGQAAPLSELECFDSPEAVLRRVKEGKVDVAFLDIEVPGMDGLEVTRRIRQLQPSANIVFVTGHSEHSLDAFSLMASGYLLKPVSTAAVRKQLMNLRYPVATPRERLVVRCFGKFEVFAYDKPLRFSRRKAQELFAYLIRRRGVVASFIEIADVLFEGTPDSQERRNHFRVVLSELSATLRSVGAENVLVKEASTLSVRVDSVECDFFDYFQGEAKAVAAFKGEFMTQYGWAEPMVAMLERRKALGSENIPFTHI